MKPRTVFYLTLVIRLTKQDSSEYITVFISHMLAIQILLQNMLTSIGVTLPLSQQLLPMFHNHLLRES